MLSLPSESEPVATSSGQVLTSNHKCDKPGPTLADSWRKKTFPILQETTAGPAETRNIRPSAELCHTLCYQLGQ